MLYFSVGSPGREMFEDVRGMKPQVLAVLFRYSGLHQAYQVTRARKGDDARRVSGAMAAIVNSTKAELIR